MKVDLKKTYKTRGGLTVHLYTTAGHNPRFPVIGEYGAADVWFAGAWTLEGRWVTGSPDDYDLVEAKPPLPVITVYRTEEKKPQLYRTVFIPESTGFIDNEGRWLSHREGVIPPPPWWANYAE